jgi:hypothetical protein
MSKAQDLEVTFHAESADRSVGIMSEGFSAWNNAGTCWCDLSELVPPTFKWFANDIGDEVAPPPNAATIEKLLHAFVDCYYMSEGGD